MTTTPMTEAEGAVLLLLLTRAKDEAFDAANAVDARPARDTITAAERSAAWVRFFDAEDALAREEAHQEDLADERRLNRRNP